MDIFSLSKSNYFDYTIFFALLQWLCNIFCIVLQFFFKTSNKQGKNERFKEILQETY